MGAEELPEVFTVRLSAVRVPPPVTMIPPEVLLDVVTLEFAILMTPSPIANTALACTPSVVISESEMLSVPPLARTYIRCRCSSRTAFGATARTSTESSGRFSSGAAFSVRGRRGLRSFGVSKSNAGHHGYYDYQ